MKKFREQALYALLGLVGLGVPAETINYFTYGINPKVVIVGVAFASMVGYGFGAWSITQDVREQIEEQEACSGCGVITQEAVCHSYDCPEAQQ